MQNELEGRKGEGILLLINKDSNYGLSSYQPITEDHRHYKYYMRYKEQLEKDPDFCMLLSDGTSLTRKQTEAFIHCMGCKAEKINNFERYCSLCSEYWRKIKD
jgi:hypothetical protein